MKDINTLKEEFEKLIKSEDPLDFIFEFKEVLLSNDSIDFLEFHFNIINNDSVPNNIKSMIQSFFWAETANERNQEKVGNFLFEKFNTSNDIGQKSNVLQILGHIRSKYAKELALQNINSDNKILRYKSIIVLGWVGSESELESLNNSLIKDIDGELRGYSATAMRQIWFNHEETKNKILNYLKTAIPQENDDEALIGIIITVQDLLKKKLGLKESSYGDVSGDVQKAKIKTIEALKNH